MPASEDKYKVVSPETMQEAFISDSEDEGGENSVVCLTVTGLTPSVPVISFVDGVRYFLFWISLSRGQRISDEVCWVELRFWTV